MFLVALLLSHSPAQVLVVSPDAALLQAVHSCLRGLGHESLLARDLRQAQWTLNRAQVDLLCLDNVLPSSDMERFWRWLRSDGERSALPLLVLAPPSAKLVAAALPTFFQAERDGLVVKPLKSAALAREVARLLAAGPRRAQRDDLLQVGPLTLDGVTYRLLFAGGGALSLTTIEYRLVRYLMQHQGEFISSDELLEQVWGFPSGTGGPEVVRSHISNVRRKLRELGEDPQLLRTIPYHGYGLVVEESALTVS